jgi:twitching motility protein PilU
VKVAKDVPAPAREDLEITGPNPAITEVVNAVAGGRHPTLNTKPLFKLMVERKASDLFFTSNAPIKIKIEGQILSVNKQVLTPETVRQTAYALMTSAQREHFISEWELDFAVSEPGLGRFRVNVFMQRSYPAMVMRYITADMPRLDSLGLPEVVSELTLLKRGLVLMVGATGSGKSTTLAAMLNFRNENSSDHIVTIEDPIEFLHTNKRSIVNQREVGLDTKTYARALRGVVRAAQSDLPRPVAVPARHHGAAPGDG